MENRSSVFFSALLLVTFYALALNIFYNIEHGDLMAVYQAAERFRAEEYSIIFGPPAVGETALFSDDVISTLDFPETVFGKYLSTDVPYVYPPLWAALLAPVTDILKVSEFSNAILIFHLGLLTLSLWLCFRLADFPKRNFWTWVLCTLPAGVFTLPLFLALLQNQPQITIFTLTTLSFWFYIKGYSATAGGILGLAAAIKILPLFFILIFIADRNWRALAAFTVSSGSLALLSFVLTGVQLHLDFLHEVSNLRNLVVISSVNLNLEMLFYLVASTFGLTPPLPEELPVIFTVAEPLWIKAVNLVVMISGLFLILKAAAVRQENNPHKRLLCMMIAISLWSALCAPVSWAHYFLMPMFLAPALPGLVRHGEWATAGCILTSAFSLLNASHKPIEGLTWLHSTLTSTVFFLILFFWVVFFPQNGRTTAPE